MIIKKGKVTKTEIASTGETITTKATIIEKTDGNYTEILGCRTSWEVTIDGTVLTSEYRECFDVYHGKTIPEILSSYGIYGDYVWYEPMEQV